MNSIKRFTLLLITILLIIGACGCMDNVAKNSAEQMKDKALEHLNNLYDDSFTPTGYSSKDWSYDYSTVTFLSQKYGGSVIVRIEERDEELICSDNYFELTMQAEAEKYFKEIAAAHNCIVETKVNFISMGDSQVDALAPFVDYVEKGICHMEVYLISNKELSQTETDAILKNICDAKIKGIVRFLVTDEEDLFSGFSIDEIVNEKADSVLNKKSFTINNEFQVEE